jgi:hypothetical protein
VGVIFPANDSRNDCQVLQVREIQHQFAPGRIELASFYTKHLYFKFICSML